MSVNNRKELDPLNEVSGEASNGPKESINFTDAKLCRLCILAAIIFAFGKEALLFI